MTTVLQDLNYALRLLRKNPGFAAVAVLTLAVGIGANTAMFSVIHGVLLRPLPFEEPERIVHIWHTPPQSSFPGQRHFAVSPANFLDWKAQSQSFEGMAILGGTGKNLTGAGEPENIAGQEVSADYFSMVGVSPLLGRAFAPGEDEEGKNNVIVLSHALWQSHFGGDRGVIGRTVHLDDLPYTIAGVMPKSFNLPEWAQFWTPIVWTPTLRGMRGVHDYSVVARLKSGVTLEQANAELTTISKRLEEQYPEDNRGWGAEVVSMHADMVGDIRPALLVLLGAVFFVLLIACVNVANLMLAKVLGRQKEIAVRNALGASRWRIVQQILIESTLMAVAGGVLGAVIAYGAVRAILSHMGDQLPRATEISVNLSVLLFTLAISGAAGILSGLVPALRLSRTNVNDALKRGAGRGAEAGGGRTRAVLVVAEVALSLMLLAGAGLLLRTLWALQNVDPGFDRNNVLAAHVSVPGSRFRTPEEVANFYAQILQGANNVPGAESAALVNSLPLGGGSTQPIQIEGQPVVAMADQPEMPVRHISAHYFRTLRIPVVRGREFNEGDTLQRPRAVVVSEAMANRYWPNQDAIGKRLKLTFADGGERQVVGVVRDVKVRQLSDNEVRPTVYVPISQVDPPAPQYGSFQAPGMWLVTRTGTNPMTVLPALKNVVQQASPGIPLVAPQTLEEWAAESLTPQRFNFLLLGAFAAVALLLAVLGIYSVLAYSVRRRTQEIGIRMAIGAQIGDVLRLVLREGMSLVLIGIALGLAGALALSRFMQSMLFNVGATDVPTFLTVAGLLALVALAACYVPAHRASKVEPVVALRYE